MSYRAVRRPQPAPIFYEPGRAPWHQHPRLWAELQADGSLLAQCTCGAYVSLPRPESGDYHDLGEIKWCTCGERGYSFATKPSRALHILERP